MSLGSKRTTTLGSRVGSVALLAARAWRGPTRPPGHYNLALQYKREGKLTEAVAECQKAIAAAARLRRGPHDAGQPVPRPEELPAAAAPSTRRR